MDFSFRAIFHRNAICSSGSQSSNYTYFTQQAIQCEFESYNGGRYDHFLGNRDVVMMERQLEKERIRREILAEEAARRRQLEAEVRRELREEREMELRQRERTNYVEHRSFAGYVEHRSSALPSQARIYDDEELPFQRAPQAAHLYVLKPEEGKQIIFSAEPEANHSGKKRKDMASSLEGPDEVTKKLTKEWSCDLCQISATSKQGLEDHLKGKKHKSKQAGLGMIGLCSEKISDPLDTDQVGKGNAGLGKSQQTSSTDQVGEGNVGLGKSQQTSSRNETDVENNKIAIVKKTGYEGAVQMRPKNKKMKFKFYCKLCEVGAFSEEVMNDHKKGKKHLIRLGAK